MRKKRCCPTCKNCARNRERTGEDSFAAADIEPLCPVSGRREEGVIRPGWSRQPSMSRARRVRQDAVLVVSKSVTAWELPDGN